MQIVAPQISQQPPPSTPTQPPQARPPIPRKFPDFLEHFELYARDGFTPEIFNTWAGISIIAGALERKVWLQWNQTLRYYPNLYVLLVSLPGAGKSTAVNRAVGLLEPLYREGRKVNFLPSQVTEAKLIELMTQKATFHHGGKAHYHCSGYYYASEASDSLKEIYGDITSTMTNLYDCPDLWQKATKKDGLITIENGCFNLLAGSTFNYLGQLVNDTNVMGGFASRLTYVVSSNDEIRKSQFPVVGEVIIDDALKAIRNDLVHDLKRINEMTGPFDSTPEFREAWEAWDQSFQIRRRDIDSEKMRTLLVRTATSMHKLCMVLSASESSDRILKLPHLEKAKSLLKTTEDALPRIFREARANNIQSADGLHNSILLLFTEEGDFTYNEASRKLVRKGFDVNKVNGALNAFLANKTMEQTPGGKLKLLIDPNKYV